MDLITSAKNPVIRALRGLRERSVLHRDVIDREQILDYVLKKTGE